MDLASNFLASAANWVTNVTSAAATRLAAAAGSSTALPDRLPVSLVYATTTGASKRFAETVQQEIFAMGLAGFWFDIQMVNAAELTMDSVDALLDSRKQNGVLVVLMPTWTDGKPPASGELLFDAINDLATDFRVDKAEYAGLRFAVFALGSSVYADAGNHARAGRELWNNLRTLGAQPIAELGVGDDTSDMGGEFKGWCEGELYPTLCELYSAAYGGDGASDDEGAGDGGDDSDEEEAEAQEASTPAGGACCGGGSDNSESQGCGCSGGGGASSKGAAAASGPGQGIVDRRGLRGQGIGFGDDGSLTLRQWRKAKRVTAAEQKAEAEAATRAAARKERARLAAEAAAAAAPVAEADPTFDARGIELTEEDLENDRLLAEADANAAAAIAAVALDSDSDGESGVAGGKRARPARAGSGGEGVGDVEDLGAAIAAAAVDKEAASEAASGTKPLPEMLTPAQRAALTKEGYQLIGTHSAVKLCRWTKAQLRGRGGCYKHTGYGIESYACMEVRGAVRPGPGTQRVE